MEMRIMLNVAAKLAEATNDLTEGAPRVNGRNEGLENARAHTVSVLGEGMTVTGDVSGEGELRIQGRVEGSVSTDGCLIVEASGEVLGDIEAAEVVASGKVSGKISSSGAVRLQSGCLITADVEATTVCLEEGGIVNGRLNMGSPKTSSRQRSTQ
jgi:cytoskeletal protein CcmA (bactofilin family)